MLVRSHFTRYVQELLVFISDNIALYWLSSLYSHLIYCFILKRTRQRGDGRPREIQDVRVQPPEGSKTSVILAETSCK